MTKPKLPKAEKINTRTIGGNPSICEWELTLTFKTKDQCEAFITRIFAARLNAYPSFSFDENEVGGIRRFTISLEYIWAHNLVTFAEMLDEVDFKDNH